MITFNYVNIQQQKNIKKIYLLIYCKCCKIKLMFVINPCKQKSNKLNEKDEKLFDKFNKCKISKNYKNKQINN